MEAIPKLVRNTVYHYYSRYDDKTYQDCSSFICIAGSYYDYPKRKNPSFITVDRNDLCVTDAEFVKFCRILNMWGFPNVLSKTDIGFTCTFPPEKYSTEEQFLAAVTIFRYAIKTSYFRVLYGTDGVIHVMFEYKKNHPKLDYFKCFQIACYLTMEGTNCPGHSCFIKVSKIVSFKELKKKFPVVSVNSLFFKQTIDGFIGAYASKLEFKKMHNLINLDEKAALKRLL